MRGIFILNLLTVIIEPIATAQHYFPNITDLLEDMYQYQQQHIINFCENCDCHHIEYYEGLLYNDRNKLVNTIVSILLKASTWILYVEHFCFLLIPVCRYTIANIAVTP